MKECSRPSGISKEKQLLFWLEYDSSQSPRSVNEAAVHALVFELEVCHSEDRAFVVNYLAEDHGDAVEGTHTVNRERVPGLQPDKNSHA